MPNDDLPKAMRDHRITANTPAVTPTVPWISLEDWMRSTRAQATIIRSLEKNVAALLAENERIANALLGKQA